MDETPDDWRRVWAAIDARRIAIPMTLTALYEASVSESTYRKMATDGVGVARTANRVLICRALGWTDDSIDRLLSGGEAEVKPSPSLDAGDVLEAIRRKLADVEARVAQLEQSDPPPDAGAQQSGPVMRHSP